MIFVVIFFTLYFNELYSYPQNLENLPKYDVCLSEQTRCAFGVYDYGVSTKDRVLIVNKHNEYRQQIADNRVPNQPKGVDLMKLKYDTHLAILAQRVADKCHYGYTSQVQDKIIIGENMFMTMSGSYEDKPNWTEAIDNWWSQHDMYLFGGPISAENRHYVQMVWSRTSRIGCGYVAFPLKCGHFIYYRFYVCHYTPGLVKLGRVTYPYNNETGSPSTPCYELCN